MHGQFPFRASILISRICSKSCSNWICSVSCFRQRSLFLTEIKQTFRAQNLASRESNGEEKLTQFIQQFAPKAVQTEFAVRHAFENRTEKKIWHNSFKNLLQKLLKLNLKCVMALLSTDKPLLIEIKPSNLECFLKLNTFLWTSSYTMLCSWCRIYLSIPHLSGTGK